MILYQAQGTCTALEDAVTLGRAFEESDMNVASALKFDERPRIARAARVVLSAREMGRIYHAADVERLVRNNLWRTHTPERFYDAVEWLYGCNPAECLDDGDITKRLVPVAA